MKIQARSDREPLAADAGATTPDPPTWRRRSIPLERLHTVVRRVPWTPSTSTAGRQPSIAGLR